MDVRTILFIALPEADSVNMDFIQMHRQTFKFKQFHRGVMNFIDEDINMFFRCFQIKKKSII